MTSPEALELEAVDAALAGRYVAPEHAELAELALLLRDDRPEPALAWSTHLDRRVAAGFPAVPRKPRFRWIYTQAAPVVAVLLLLAIPITLAATLGGGGPGAARPRADRAQVPRRPGQRGARGRPRRLRLQRGHAPAPRRPEAAKGHR